MYKYNGDKQIMRLQIRLHTQGEDTLSNEENVPSHEQWVWYKMCDMFGNYKSQTSSHLKAYMFT